MKNWKHRIKIKHLFEDETTPELVVKLCDELVTQLNTILNIYESSDGVYHDLESCIDNFEFLKKLADGSIKESEWGDYCFEGDFEKEFNGYMYELYEVSDADKLIWIE